LLFGRSFSRCQWATIIFVSIVGIDAGLWFLDPQLAWYVGLSGVLHGMLAAGIVPEVRKGNIEAVILGILLAGKIAWEQLLGPLPGSVEISGGNVVVSAHFYGAVSGLLAGTVLIRARPRRPV
jgi:rhomboid family GlyGly-CTERM serine protease